LTTFPIEYAQVLHFLTLALPGTALYYADCCFIATLANSQDQLSGNIPADPTKWIVNIDQESYPEIIFQNPLPEFTG
jgi:hypothetical protein